MLQSNNIFICIEILLFESQSFSSLLFDLILIASQQAVLGRCFIRPIMKSKERDYSRCCRKEK